MRSTGEFRSRLGAYRESILQAIARGRTDVVASGMEAYVDFVRAFVETLHELNARYEPGQAEGVSFVDWPILDDFVHDVYEIVEESVRSAKRDMVRIAIGGLALQLNLALEMREHLVFRSFTEVYPDMVRCSFAAGSAEDGRMVRGWVWRSLKQFEEFKLGLLIRESSDEKLDWIVPYYRSVIEAFAAMLKACVDQESLEALAETGEAFDRIGSGVGWTQATLQSRGSLSETIESDRLAHWFGLGAWEVRLFYLYLNPDPTLSARARYGRGIAPSLVAEMVRLVGGHFESLQVLADVYVQCIDDGSYPRWWSISLFEEFPEGQVYTFDYKKWLTLFFCVRALQLVPSGVTGGELALPPVRAMKDRSSALERVLEELVGEAPSWNSVIMVDNLDGRAESLMRAVRSAAKDFERFEEDEIIRAEISTAKVDEFKADVVEAWRENAWVRGLVARFGRREMVGPDVATHEEPTGIVGEMYPKEPFLERTTAIWVGVGQHVGRDLAQRECGRVLSDWLGNEEVEHVEGSASDIAQLLEGAMARLRTKGYTPSAIILFCRHRVLRQLDSDVQFIPGWRSDSARIGLSNFEGTLENVPVFWWQTDVSPSALVLDLEQFGVWRDYQLSAEEPRVIDIRVTGMTESHAQAVSYSSPNLTPRDVLQKVMVRASVVFQYSVTDPQAAIRVDLVDR